MSIQFADHDQPVTTNALFNALIDPNRMDFEIAIHSAGCSKPNSRKTWVVMLGELRRHWVPFYTAARALLGAGANPDAMLRMRHRDRTTQRK